MDYICIECGKKPSELSEYVYYAEQEGITPEQFVYENEGTFNFSNGHFLCTDCYIKVGMPSSPHGWKAP